MSKTVTVQLYADEIKQCTNTYGQNWMYLGMLAIPEDHRSYALNLLLEDRKAVPYHGERHFSDLTQRPKIELAKRWLNRVMWDDRKCFHFYILGLNIDSPQRKAFGDQGTQQARNIYNRFFRCAITYVLKNFFGDNKRIVVSAIFHDKTEMEYDDIFDWHTIWKVNLQEEKIVFLTGRIAFIDSDRRKEEKYPDDSHFIQLTDVTLGAVGQCLDCTSRRKGLREVAKTFLPLVKRLTDKRRCSNPNSRYQHFRRCSIAFFPSKRLTLQELEDPWKRVQSSFFVNRRLAIVKILSGQQRLFEEG